ncbi:MAG TPA: hypothetical protein V6D17_23990 [Candidatus Obscuribacterales bacterium]
MKVLVAVDDLEYSLASLESIKQRRWPEESQFLLCRVIEGIDPNLQHPEALSSSEHACALARERTQYIKRVHAWLVGIADAARSVLKNVDAVLEFGSISDRLCAVAQLAWSSMNKACLLLAASMQIGIGAECI